jgi:hypothetical protein
MDKPLRQPSSFISVHAHRLHILTRQREISYTIAKVNDPLAVLLYEQRAREQRVEGTTTARMLAESL